MKLRAYFYTAAISLIAAFPAPAQEWRFDFDRTSSLVSIGFSAFDAASLFLTEYGFRDAGYIRFGGGPAFSDDYYFLIPELESSFSWYSGMELVKGSVFNSTRAYTSFELEQVLAGDRYHLKRWMSAAIGDQSRLVFPAAAVGGAPEAFFLHRPQLRLSANAADDPFWSVLQLQLNAAGALEIGHSAALGLWAFPVA